MVNGKDNEDKVGKDNEGTKIALNVVKDCLSFEEIGKLVQCVGEVEKNKENRAIKISLGIYNVIMVSTDYLSVDELKNILQCIRDIEQNKPERHINIFMNTPEKTVQEMESVFDSVKPGFPFKTVIEKSKKEDKIN